MDNRDLATELCNRWDRDASALEREAEHGQAYSKAERAQLRMHARVKRSCANELRIEARKVRRG